MKRLERNGMSHNGHRFAIRGEHVVAMRILFGAILLCNTRLDAFPVGGQTTLPGRRIHFPNGSRRTKSTQTSMISDVVLDAGGNLQTILTQNVALPYFGKVSVEDLAKVVMGVPVALLATTTTYRSVPERLLDTTLLRAIVQDTYLERMADNVQCVYKATQDGWSAIDFHEAVDGRGSGIVVARTMTGQIFGGYNANGWRSTDDYYSSTASFLWYSSNGSKKGIKLPVVSGGDAAVFDYATSGPCFGAADCIIGPPRAAVMGGFAGPDAEDIGRSAGSLRQCTSAIGSTYRGDPNWPARGAVRLSEVEVYCVDR